MFKRQAFAKAICGASPFDGRHLLENFGSMAWLEVAAKLPGRSMHVAVLLLHLATTEKTPEVVLSNRACERLGLHRNAKYRALLFLEAAGLIQVKRKPGQSPLVKICAAEAPNVAARAPR